jgi:putative FmdB family regulatory protein
MPIHDYQCSKCGQRAELLALPNQPPVCPSCGSTKLERQFSHSAAVSTARSRQRAMKGARSRANAEKREKDAAHAEYLSNHIKDHSNTE